MVDSGCFWSHAVALHSIVVCTFQWVYSVCPSGVNAYTNAAVIRYMDTTDDALASADDSLRRDLIKCVLPYKMWCK